MSVNEWPKRCACGREYFPGEWAELPFVGYQAVDDGVRLELRNCVCNSTLAIYVEPNGLPWTLAGDLATLFRKEADERAGRPDPYAWPPQRPREVSAEARAEAERLDGIADELMARVSAAAARFASPEAA